MTLTERDVPSDLDEAIGPAHTALLINDMQNDFCIPGGKIYDRAAKQPEMMAGLIQELSRLIHAAKASAATVVYVQQMHLPNATDVPTSHMHHLKRSGLATTVDDLPCIRGSWGHEIIETLAPGPNDIVIDKAAFNNFHNTLLDKVLRIRGVETVVLTGVSSHSGILGTVFGLIDCGYRFFIPREGVTGYEAKLHDAAMIILRPHTVPIEAIHRAWNRA